MATAPGIDALYGGHFNLTSSEFASAMNWRLTLLPENANCSAYLTQPATPETLAYLAGNVSDGTNAVGTNVRSCDDAGIAADECCHAWKGYHRASRVWYQDSDLSANAADEAFGSSELLGAGIHTHPHATVGDFNADAYPDVIVGNRLYVNNGRGSLVHAAGAEIGHGTRAFKMVFAGDIDGVAPTTWWSSMTTGRSRCSSPSTARRTRPTWPTRAASGSGRWARRWRLARRR